VGADLANVGLAFIATDEANANPAYKQGIVDGTAEDATSLVQSQECQLLGRRTNTIW
jgi:NAD(P)H-dependent flavin oxidoreductase YrpB (nitropropane dioxygenase family)